MNEQKQARIDRRLRLLEILVGVVIIGLLIALLSGNGVVRREQLQDDLAKLADEAVVHAVEHMTYEAGDTYQFTVQGDGTDLRAATQGLFSSVSIYAGFTVRDGRFTDMVYSGGAGVIYSMDKDRGDAYILTNYHVVYYGEALDDDGISDAITLFLFGKEGLEAYEIPATFVGGSPYYDIAVLKVSGSAVLRESAAREAVFADSDTVSILDTAIAVGNPATGGLSATVGHINVDSENIVMPVVTDETRTVTMRVMRTDTAVNSGNSGGGLYNARGELIGIVNAKIADSEIENIGYAIPSNVVKNLADNILYYCDGTEKTSAYRTLLGITVAPSASHAAVDSTTGKAYIHESVSVASVNAGALADGHIREGDIIRGIRVGDVYREVTRTFHVVDIMLCARVGDTVVFTIERGGTEQTVTLQITASALTEY